MDVFASLMGGFQTALQPINLLVAFIGVLVVAIMLEAEIRVLGREKIGNLPINAWLAGTTQKRRPE